MVPNERLTAFLLVVCAICLTVTGELFLKTGMNRVGQVGLHNVLTKLVQVIRTPQIWAGMGFALAGAVLWLTALSRAPLSWAYPILSLGYILVLIFSRVILKEPVSAVRWLGTAIVVCGIWVVFRSWK